MRWAGIVEFRLVTADLHRLAAFYQAIGFSVGPVTEISQEEMWLLGLGGTGRRKALRLNGSRLSLDSFDPPGAPYPSNATAADLVFQHLALVTDDAAADWIHVRAAGATAISRDGPVTLPASAGGVTAVKFRDPDGHPLELLQFPPGWSPDWSGTGLMGIDHSAMSVSDVEASRRFFAEHGLAEGRTSINKGPTQVALDALDDVCVDVVPMKPSAGPPHVELLGYRHPIGRGHAPLASNDIAATRIVWRAHVDALLRGPEGHLHQLSR